MKRTSLLLIALTVTACTVSTSATTPPPTLSSVPTTSGVSIDTTTTDQDTSGVTTTTATLPMVVDRPNEVNGPKAGEWIRIYASLETATTTEQQATAMAETLPDSKLLLSDNYPSLNPGYWVVYTGGFDDRYSAGLCPTDLPEKATCYPRWIGDPVVAKGSAVALIAGELFELTPRSEARTLGNLQGEASWVYNLNLSVTRDSIIFAEGTEDYWYSCESSAGTIYSFDLQSQQRRFFSEGTSPTISPDGSQVAWLHSSTCIDDPTTSGWVLTPADTIMVRDLDAAGDHSITVNVPLDGAFDSRELAYLAWIDNDTLLASDFNTSSYLVPVNAETFGDNPILDGVVGTVLGYGNEGLLVLDDNGGEGNAFEWWLLAVDVDTGSADLLMTGPDYITVGVNPDGEIIMATDDTFWLWGEEPFKAPGYIEAIDW